VINFLLDVNPSCKGIYSKPTNTNWKIRLFFSCFVTCYTSLSTDLELGFAYLLVYILFVLSLLFEHIYSLTYYNQTLESWSLFLDSILFTFSVTNLFNYI